LKAKRTWGKQSKKSDVEILATCEPNVTHIHDLLGSYNMGGNGQILNEEIS
jgi:hypothetical protein